MHTDTTASCIFCQISQGILPSQPLLTTDDFIVIPDARPKAPVHFLIIPRQPYTTLEEALQTEPDFGAALLATASQAAHLAHIEDNYQLHINVGLGVQQVHHLHLHLLGGWAPEKRPL